MPNDFFDALMGTFVVVENVTPGYWKRIGSNDPGLIVDFLESEVVVEADGEIAGVEVDTSAFNGSAGLGGIVASFIS